MSKKIESTVDKLSEDLANAGATGGQRVLVTLLDEDEAAELAELRQLIDDGLASGEPVDGEEVFAELRRELATRYPVLGDGPA